MTSREYGAPQENTNVVLDMATEKLYGAARIPEVSATKRTIQYLIAQLLYFSIRVRIIMYHLSLLDVIS